MTIERKARHVGTPAVLVRIEPDESDPPDAAELRIVVPCWMLDETVCSMIEVREKPQIQLRALVQLRELIDQLIMPAVQAPDESGFMEAKGDRHETRNETQAAHPDAASEATEL